MTPVTPATFVPIERHEKRTLERDGAFEVEFRPLNVDPIVIAWTVFLRERKPPGTRPIEWPPPEPPDIALLMPESMARIPLEVREGEFQTLQYRMKPGDLARPGNWRFVIVNADWRKCEIAVRIDYPGTERLLVGQIDFAEMTRYVSDVVAAIKPRFTLNSGAISLVDPTMSDGSRASGRVTQGDVIEYRFEVTEAGAVELGAIATAARRQPGEYPDHHDGDGDNQPAGLTRLIEIFLPVSSGLTEQQRRVFTRSDPGLLTFSFFDYNVNDTQAKKFPGTWILRVTNTDPRNGTITAGKRYVRGESFVEFDPSRVERVPQKIEFALRLDGVRLTDVRVDLLKGGFSVVLQNRQGPPWRDDRLPLGEIVIDGHTGPILDGIEVKPLPDPFGYVDLRLSDIGYTFTVGFDIRDRKLTVTKVHADIDLVGAPGAGGQALGFLHAILVELVENKAASMASSKDFSAMVSETLLPFLQPNVKIYYAFADQQRLYLYYYLPPRAPAGTVPSPRPRNANKVDHIVVVIMENRSFDHMLGHMTLAGRRDVDGLTGNERNFVFKAPPGYEQWKKREIKVAPLADTVSCTDPCHDGDCTLAQLGPDSKKKVKLSGGFAEDYLRHMAKQKILDATPEFVMGYHTAAQLPAYKYLYDNFVIADRWHAALAGPTQPNRAYCFAGSSDGRNQNEGNDFDAYDVTPVFKHLDDRQIDWRFYYHNVASLWLVRGYLIRQDKIRHIDERSTVEPGFFARAEAGTLPPVTFVDPDLLGIPTTRQHNDDHPPSDVSAGQDFIQRVYNALCRFEGKFGKKTLLIITYDEHGGFYDHVQPPPRAPDDHPATSRYGVRVPTFIVSPYVPTGRASHRFFDHTSIIKTILQVFCNTNDRIPDMGRRVNAAADVLPLLSLATPRSVGPMSVALPPLRRCKKTESPAEAGDFRSWVTEKEHSRPRQLPLPVVGMAAPTLAHDKLLGRERAGEPTLVAALRAGRWPINLIEIVAFQRSGAGRIPADRRIPLYDGGKVSTGYIRNLLKLLDEATKARPPIHLHISIFDHAALLERSAFPEGAPKELRPGFRAPVRERVLAWVAPVPSARLDRQKELVRALGEAVGRRPDVHWEIMREARIDDGKPRAADQAVLARWLAIMHTELEAVADARPSYVPLPRREWLGAQPAEGVRAALRGAGGEDGTGLVLLRDDGTAAEIETRAGAALRQGAGYLATVAYPPARALDARMLDSLARAANQTKLPERAYLAFYDLASPTRRSYDKLHAAIRRFDHVRKIEHSGWIFSSRLSLAQVTDALLPLVNGDDTLVVLPIDGAPVDGRVPQREVKAWLERRVASRLRP